MTSKFIISKPLTYDQVPLNTSVAEITVLIVSIGYYRRPQKLFGIENAQF